MGRAAAGPRCAGFARRGTSRRRALTRKQPFSKEASNMNAKLITRLSVFAIAGAVLAGCSTEQAANTAVGATGGAATGAAIGALAAGGSGAGIGAGIGAIVGGVGGSL